MVNRSIWADDPDNFERLRQNFTTSLFIDGPNMTLEEMSEYLCELREENEALRTEVQAWRDQFKGAMYLNGRIVLCG